MSSIPSRFPVFKSPAPATPENGRAIIEAYARNKVAKDRLLFVLTANPLYAWSALKMSLTVFRETPPWVLEYLDASARRLTDADLRHIQGLGPSEWQPVVTTALGFDTRQSASRNPFRRLSTDLRDVNLSAHVQVLIADGHQLTYAREEVARVLDSTVPIVRAAWDRFGAALALEDIEVLKEIVSESITAHAEARTLFDVDPQAD